MNRQDLGVVIDVYFDRIRELNGTKGVEYCHGDEDALANLRDMPELGITGLQKAMVYLDKHYRAIQSYCRTGDVLSEPIEGRIADMVLYLILLGALVEERRPGKLDRPLPTLDEVREGRAS